MGLLYLDLVFGLAKALRTQSFDFKKLAQFYATNVLPYLIGYAALYVAFSFVFPADYALSQEVSKNGAWGILVASLTTSIYHSAKAIYGTVRAA
jgi:hypothetical protein